MCMRTLEWARWTQALLAGAERAASPAEAELTSLLAPFDSALRTYLGRPWIRVTAAPVCLSGRRSCTILASRPHVRWMRIAMSFRGHEALSGRLAGSLLERLAFSAEASRLVARTCTEASATRARWPR